MKVLIAGSRSISDFDLSRYIPTGTELIITGGATGVDTIAEAYADKHKISKLIIRPEYSRYGKAAPLKRNEQMVDKPKGVEPLSVSRIIFAHICVTSPCNTIKYYFVKGALI